MRPEQATTVAGAWDRHESIVEYLRRHPQSLVTPLIESRFGERTYAQRILQRWRPADHRLSEVLDVGLGHRVLTRRIVLRGRSTGNAYLAGHSWIVLERLPLPMAVALLMTDTPIGTLLGSASLRTGRDLLEHDVEPAGSALAGTFDVPSATSLSVRRYRVAGQRPLMWVCERFHPCVATGVV